jgi:hypothetical protein
MIFIEIMRKLEQIIMIFIELKKIMIIIIQKKSKNIIKIINILCYFIFLFI